MSTRILLADDHQIVREGLKSLLEQKGLEIVGEATNGNQAISMAKELRPDIAILDLSMPGINGIDASRQLLLDTPTIKVILLTMHTEEHYVLAALKAGVAGYVVKTEASTDLIRAINEIGEGATYLSPKVSRALIRAYLEEKDESQNLLTPRELQILQVIAEGMTNKEAAALLGVSVKTIEAHRTAIMKKLDMHSVAGLIRYAIRINLIDP